MQEEFTIIDLIQEEMTSDDANRESQSDRLIMGYKKCTAEQKEAVDSLMMCLCGWTIPTLIDMHSERINK